MKHFLSMYVECTLVIQKVKIQHQSKRKTKQIFMAIISLHQLNLFVKLFASIVAQNQYCYLPETYFHENGSKFLPGLCHRHHFSFGLNGNVCWFWNKMEFFSTIIIVFASKCTLFYFCHFILIVWFKKVLLRKKVKEGIQFLRKCEHTWERKNIFLEVVSLWISLDIMLWFKVNLGR